MYIMCIVSSSEKYLILWDIYDYEKKDTFCNKGNVVLFRITTTTVKNYVNSESVSVEDS